MKEEEARREAREQTTVSACVVQARGGRRCAAGSRRTVQDPFSQSAQPAQRQVQVRVQGSRHILTS